MIWFFSSLSVVTAVIIALCVYGVIIYRQAFDLFNSTNEKIIQKTGLEATADINSAIVEQVEKIVNKKIDTVPVPERARNIFFYNSFIPLEQLVPPETAAPTSSEPSLDKPQ